MEISDRTVGIADKQRRTGPKLAFSIDRNRPPLVNSVRLVYGREKT